MVITPAGNKAILKGNISKAHERDLQEKFAWCELRDMSDTKLLYADKIMYVGLMWDVCEELRNLGYDCNVDIPDLPNAEYDWQFKWGYRYRQDELVESALTLRYGLIEAPAGSGKTPVAAAIIANAGLQAVFLVEEQAPFYQAYNTFTEAIDGAEIGLFGDGQCNIQPITICMVQSWQSKVRQAYIEEILSEALDEYRKTGDITVFKGFPDARVRKHYKQLRKRPTALETQMQALLETLKQKNAKDAKIIEYLRNAKVVLIDEAHNMGAESYLEIVESLHSPEMIIGVSATPFREDERQELIYAVCGPVIDSISIEEAIKNNMIVPITFVVQDAPHKDYGYTVSDDEKRKHVSQVERRRQFKEVRDDYIMYNPERHKLYANFVQYCLEEGLSCAVIEKEIKHGNSMAKFIPGAVELYGTASKAERDKVWNALNEKRIMCVITTLMGEATNVPSLNAVAIAAGGKSKKDFIQRMRCSRIFEGVTSKGPEKKTEGLVYFTYDHTDFLRSHSATILKYTRQYVKQHKDNRLEYL